MGGVDVSNGELFHLADHLDRHSLVFLTSEDTLAQLGWERDAFEQAVRSPHHPVVMPTFSGDIVDKPVAAAAHVRARLNELGTVDGVVIIGGYDTVPPRRIDPLPGDLRERVCHVAQSDTDNFYVWNDDHYVDLDETGLPSLPVSRIPSWTNSGVDGELTCQEFVINCLEATILPPGDPPPAEGARASEFRFGDGVYAQHLAQQAGDGMWVSPTDPPHSPPHRTSGQLQSTYLYLVLHGIHDDGTWFAGTSIGGSQEKVVDLNLFEPAEIGDTQLANTIFASCCWGALISQFTAEDTDDFTTSIGERTPKTSIPIEFIALGSLGYVGFTGTHHGPNKDDDTTFSYHGEPLHHKFWEERITHEHAPSLALFEARKSYLAGAPYQTTGDTEPFDPSLDPFSRAIELKTFWSATCLGLGW
jgi:hypothetical protein